MKAEINRIERPALSDSPMIPIIIHFSDDDEALPSRFAEIYVFINRKDTENKTLEEVSKLGLSQAYSFLEDILNARPG